MKNPFCNKTLAVVAVALAAAGGSIVRAQDQPMPAPATEAPLPPEVAPNTPLAEVVKLVQSGVDVSTILNFISNSPTPFDLDSDKIIAMNDAGVPKDVVNAMLNRDKALYAAANTPPPPETAPTTTADTTTDTAPPTAPVTVNYFDDTLSPYGSWVVVGDYGRCWRPTTVIYDSGWRPYCDRGHWVYTDCGWYWDSDYAWGVTFHYGRWFRDTRFGWCWCPDTVWGPSWVTWRSSGDYCGWGPLPPRAEFRPGLGFYYRGISVSADFNFGLGADCFTFVTPDHFLEHHPRRFSVEPQRAPEIFNRTTVINNFNNRDKFIVNNGIPVTQVGAHVHQTIQPVRVGALPNAGRQGWRGPVVGVDANHPFTHVSAGNANNNPARNQVNGNGNLNHQPGSGGAGQPHANNQPVGSPYTVQHQSTVQTTVNHNNNQPDRTGQNNRNIIINHNSSQLESRSYNPNPSVKVQQQVQPPQHFSAPVITEHPSAPPALISPSPAAEPQHVEQRAPQMEQRSEERQSHVEAVQHNPPPAAPAPSESHNENRGSDNQKNQNQNH